MSNQICQNLFTQFEDLKTLNRALFSDIQSAKSLTDYQQLRKQTVELKQHLAELKDKILLIIKDAPNPYHEAYTAGGITDPIENPERQDVKLDLVKTLRYQQQVWRDKGMNAWADAIAELEPKLKNLSPEKKQIMAEEINDGCIPIFMPGREAQLQTTVENFKQQLKPRYIDSEKGVQAADESLVWEHIENLINTKSQELVEDIPTNPYILFTKPTQKPEERTLKKTVEQQKVELKLINHERQKQNKPKASAQNMHEYSALQIMFADAIVRNKNLKEFAPLDKDTFTLFIDLPWSSDFEVPSGCWEPINCRLEFGGFYADDQFLMGGFRFSVRVEI